MFKGIKRLAMPYHYTTEDGGTIYVSSVIVCSVTHTDAGVVIDEPIVYRRKENPFDYILPIYTVPKKVLINSFYSFLFEFLFACLITIYKFLLPHFKIYVDFRNNNYFNFQTSQITKIISFIFHKFNLGFLNVAWLRHFINSKFKLNGTYPTIQPAI